MDIHYYFFRIYFWHKFVYQGCVYFKVFHQGNRLVLLKFGLWSQAASEFWFYPLLCFKFSECHLSLLYIICKVYTSKLLWLLRELIYIPASKSVWCTVSNQKMFFIMNCQNVLLSIVTVYNFNITLRIPI